MDAASVTDLAGGAALLHAFFLLPSPDAFRLSSTCRTVRALLEGSGEAASCQLAADRFGIIVASHSQDHLWLHALLDAPLVAAYAKQAKTFTVLGDLCFHASCEVATLLAALDSCRRAPRPGALALPGCDGDLFAGAWTFEPQDLAILTDPLASALIQAPIVSRPERLCWTFQGELLLLFELRLRLTPAGEGQLLLALEPRFVGETTVEERDCIEVHVVGLAVMPGDPGSAPQVCAVRPWVGGPSGPWEVAAVPPPIASGPVCEALRRDGALTCAYKVLLCSMGEQMRVTSFASPEVSGAAKRGWHMGTVGFNMPLPEFSEEVGHSVRSCRATEEDLAAALLASQGASGAQPSFHASWW